MLLGGCILSPKGAKEAEARLKAAGEPYAAPFEQRELPDLPSEPTWREVLQRAFLANGDLEAAYFDWAAAVRRIEMASAYPNSNISLGYSYMFSSERMKSFDRQTFAVGFDSAMNLSFPSKVAQQGRIALDEARASGERFRSAKFDLQRRVLTAWAQYALLAERSRVQKERLSVTRLSADAVWARALAGGGQRDALRTEASIRADEDTIRNTEAETEATRAMLNGMLARDAGAPLAAPPSVPAMRAFAASDDAVLAAAADRSPALAALAHQVQGRSDALELARLQWLPDINPTAVFTGSVSQAVGAVIMLPTTVVEIRGGIREAEAMLRGGDAMLRQAAHDTSASVVATLVALRNSERQARLFEDSIVPIAGRLLDNARQSYSSGAATYLELIDAQQALFDARLVVAEARAAREMRLAELEALVGADIETIAQASPPPGGHAATTPPSSIDAPRKAQESHHVH